MLPSFQRFDDQVGVGVVAGENGNSVDLRVVDDLIFGGSGILEAEFLPGVLGMQSAG
jgi:hypothetical protein